MQERIDDARVEVDLLGLALLSHHRDELHHLGKLPQKREEEPSAQQQEHRQHDVRHGLNEVALQLLAGDRQCVPHRLTRLATTPRANLLKGLLAVDAFEMALSGDRIQENVFERCTRGQRLEALLEHDAAVVDNHHPVTDLRDLRQYMRRKHDRAVARKAAYEFANLVNLSRVESDRRLVEHQHRRVMNQRLRKPYTLAVALRELAANTVRYGLKAAHLRHVFYRTFQRTASHAAKFRDEAQIRVYAHVTVKRRVLRQISNQAPRFERVRKDIEVVDDDRPRGRRHVTRDDAHRGGLARAVGSQEAQDLTALGLEGNVPDGDETAIRLGEVFNFYHRARSGALRHPPPISTLYRRFRNPINSNEKGATE